MTLLTQSGPSSAGSTGVCHSAWQNCYYDIYRWKWALLWLKVCFEALLLFLTIMTYLFIFIMQKKRLWRKKYLKTIYCHSFIPSHSLHVHTRKCFYLYQKTFWTLSLDHVSLHHPGLKPGALVWGSVGSKGQGQVHWYLNGSLAQAPSDKALVCSWSKQKPVQYSRPESTGIVCTRRMVSPRVQPLAMCCSEEAGGWVRWEQYCVYFSKAKQVSKQVRL